MRPHRDGARGRLGSGERFCVAEAERVDAVRHRYRLGERTDKEALHHRCVMLLSLDGVFEAPAPPIGS